ncbi:MAG: zinc-finger domain-containing protein [Rhizomicrobium sp.]
MAMIRPKFQTKTTMPVEVPEIIEVDDTRVACDGSGGALGHPKVYLEMGDEKYVECPYCDRRFVLRAGAHAH